MYILQDSELFYINQKGTVCIVAVIRCRYYLSECLATNSLMHSPFYSRVVEA